MNQSGQFPCTAGSTREGRVEFRYAVDHYYRSCLHGLSGSTYYVYYVTMQPWNPASNFGSKSLLKIQAPCSRALGHVQVAVF